MSCDKRTRRTIETGDATGRISRRAFTIGAGAAAGLAATGQERAAVHARSTQADDEGTPAAGTPTAGGTGAPLWQRAAARGILYGSIFTSNFALEDAAANEAYQERFAEECVLLVNNDLRWGTVRRPGLANFDFTRGDATEERAQAARMVMRGHNLCWNSSFAPGVREAIAEMDAATAEQTLVDHITEVAGRYTGQMHSWDVVNEPIVYNRPPDRPDGLKTESVWFQTIGEDYLDVAFGAAAAADPTALLFLNDVALEYGLPDSPVPARHEAMLTLLSGMLERGVPLHSLGLEAHLNSVTYRSDFDTDRYRTFLRDVADLGLSIMATELDVNDVDEPGDIAARDEAVASVYGDYLSVLLDESAVIGVTTWGMMDKYSWLQRRNEVAGGSDAQRADGLPLRPLPLDDDVERKPAWEAMARAFDNAPSRSIISPVPVPREVPE